MEQLFEIKVDEDMPEDELCFVLNGKVVLRVMNIEVEENE